MATRDSADPAPLRLAYIGQSCLNMEMPWGSTADLPGLGWDVVRMHRTGGGGCAGGVHVLWLAVESTLDASGAVCMREPCVPGYRAHRTGCTALMASPVAWSHRLLSDQPLHAALGGCDRKARRHVCMCV